MATVRAVGLIVSYPLIAALIVVIFLLTSMLTVPFGPLMFWYLKKG